MLRFSLSDVPLISWYVVVLIFLEGLLSADNALVLALMVRHLPKREQRSVLRWGIWGAVAFRLVAVILSAYLLKIWIFKVLGGAYLLYLAVKHFFQPESGSHDGSPSWEKTFWGTVAAVTFTDIAFSIDSILAAVGMAEEFPARFGDNGKLFIVFVGGVLGIITMRFVVRYFVILLDRFPGLAEGAYILVAWIGLKLVISGLHSWQPEYIKFQVPEWLFWSVMLVIAVLSMLIQPRSQQPSMTEGLDELLEGDDSADGQGPRDGAADMDRPGRDGQEADPASDGPAERPSEVPTNRGG
jgi:YkoY family integral membrane protein